MLHGLHSYENEEMRASNMSQLMPTESEIDDS